MGWWSRFRELLQGRPRPEPVIRIVDDGFELVSPGDQSTIALVRWRDVTRIHTYKIDLVTTDCIRLLFEFNGGRAPLQVSEEWRGFADLFAPLSAAFPSIPPDWYVEVMKPAFETNRRILYDATAQWAGDEPER
jgi:hypothetical protein